MSGSTEKASLERRTTLARRHEERQQLHAWNGNIRGRVSRERQEVANVSFNVEIPI